jgi:hypothetical protein
LLEDGGSDLARTGLVFDNEDFQVLKTVRPPPAMISLATE